MAQKKILIVETEDATVQMIKDTFEEFGMEYKVTSKGNEAKGLAEKFGPDLIVLCAELAQKSYGYAICSKLKKDANLKEIPLILTSAEATESTFRDHKKLPTRADEYLKKPFSPEELMETAGKLIDLSGDLGDEDIDDLDLTDDIDIQFEELDEEDELETTLVQTRPGGTGESSIPDPPEEEIDGDLMESLDDDDLEDLGDFGDGDDEDLGDLGDFDGGSGEGDDELMEALTENRNLKKKLSSLQTKCDLVESKLKKRESEIEDVRQQSQSNQDTLLQRDKELKELKDKNYGLNKEKEDVETELEMFRSKMDSINVEKEELAHKGDKSLVKLKEFRLRLNKARQEIERSRKEVEGLNKNKDELNTQLSDLKEEMERTGTELRGEISTLQKAKEEQENNLNGQITALEEEKGNLNNSIEELTSTKANLEEEIATKHQEKENIDTAFHQFKDETEEERKRLNDDIEELKMERDDLLGKISNAKTKCGEIEGQIDGLKSQLGEFLTILDT